MPRKSEITKGRRRVAERNWQSHLVQGGPGKGLSDQVGAQLEGKWKLQSE